MIMSSLLSYLPLCLVLVASTVATGQQCKLMQAKKEHLNKRLTGHLLKAATVPSYGTCAYNCLVLTDCQSINYCLGPSLCELNTEDSLTFSAHLVQANNCVFTDKQDLPKSMAGECEVNSCPASHQCIPGLQQGCKSMVQCPDLPPITPPDVLSPGSNEEGSVRQYSCEVDFVPISPSDDAMVTTATCLPTGQWTMPHFVCIQPTIGLACINDYDCQEAYSRCDEEKCICQVLYEFDFTQNNCIKRCSGYGTEWTVDDLSAVLGHTVGDALSNYTVDACKEACINAGNECPSFDFFNKICALNSVTLQQVEDSDPQSLVTNSANNALYKRNCIPL